MAARRTVKGVLVAALEKLEKLGWIQDESGNRKIGYCMTGAISASTRSHMLRLDAVAALDTVVTQREADLLKVSGFPATRVQTFNDRSYRRKRTIISIYRRAIKAAS